MNEQMKKLKYLIFFDIEHFGIDSQDIGRRDLLLWKVKKKRIVLIESFKMDRNFVIILINLRIGMAMELYSITLTEENKC